LKGFSLYGLEPQGVLPYRERRRKSTMRRVQLEGGFCLGFLPYRERRKIMERETKREKREIFAWEVAQGERQEGLGIL
jgi:hypothetical protein